jgi:hypothetical protein
MRRDADLGLIDAQFLAQKLNALLIDLQGFALLPVAGQREHQQMASALVQRMLPDDCLQLSYYAARYASPQTCRVAAVVTARTLAAPHAPLARATRNPHRLGVCSFRACSPGEWLYGGGFEGSAVCGAFSHLFAAS